MENGKRAKRTPKRKSFADDEGYTVSKKTPIIPLTASPTKVKINQNQNQSHSKSGNTNSKSGNTNSKSGNSKCQKPICPNPNVKCFAKGSKNCAIEGHSARWYHISDAEHFCNNCFDAYYRVHKEGNKRYEKFKKHWSANCRKESNLKIFFSEEFLPFWIQCNKCEKWREGESDIDLTPEYSAKFECSKIKGTKCSTAEFEYVKTAKNYLWMSSIVTRPYLKDSPAAPFLKDFYYDCIGLSPPKAENEDIQCAKFSENMIPFYRPDDSEKARCICVDVMTKEERQEFPHHVKDPSMYLGLRNIIIAMWSMNPKQYLTYKACLNHMICRGLGRITMAEELKKLLDFLTINAFVNFGILPRVPKPFNLPIYWNGSVIIIGGGIAGVGAARQLKNAGCQVTLLEASNRCGGRVKDDNKLGNCIGLGAQIITGCINNPLYIMCEQASLNLRYLGMQCDLIDDKGSLIDNSVDQDMEFRFNLMLDSLEDWKQSSNKREHEKCSLSEALTEQFAELQKSLCNDISEVEQSLLQFHLGNLEYGCGSSLKNVSAVHWNQNEEFPQYSGSHAWGVDGFEKVVHMLADDIDIKYDAQVTCINSTGKDISVSTKSGKIYTADKVICAIPLSIYKSKVIEFQPPLPEDKLKAIDRLGAGLIEKIAIKFPKAFWKKKIGEADYFGHVPSSENDRGLFSVFYDVSKGSNHILMTVIAGEAVKIKESMSDEQLVQECMKTLRNIFKDEKVPNPSSYLVSNWANDEHIKMAYSYVKVGSSGKDLDLVAKSVNNQLYFAGEVTNRQFPQTVTGAYLSGLREAKNILLSET